MRIVKVKLGGTGYESHIGSGLLAGVGLRLKGSGFAGRLVVITDTRVQGLYGDTLVQGLSKEGFDVTTLSVPEGEEQKSLETVGRLYQQLTDCHAERTTPVLALGGGVIGDMAGFVAATYMRGVPLVQIPTTLLAQVDSSIGGKVAVDHGRIKNKIGVFYQPRMVIADIDVLGTLPANELANGLAEVIKSAAIRDNKFFSFLEDNIKKVKAQDKDVLKEVVSRTAKIKADVVTLDEEDLGLRNILNYGHTIGHAIESVSDFKIGHGEAVAMGMLVAARISNKLEILEGKDTYRLKKVIEKAGLPTEMPGLKSDDLIQAMKHDKKVLQDRVRFVLLKSIGDAFITDEVSPSLVEEVLSSYE